MSLILSLLIPYFAMAEPPQLSLGKNFHIWPIKYMPGESIEVVHLAKGKKHQFSTFNLATQRRTLAKKLPKTWKSAKLDHQLTGATNNEAYFNIGKNKYRVTYNKKSYSWTILRADRQVKFLEDAPANSRILGAIATGSKVLLIFATLHEDPSDTEPGFLEVSLNKGFEKPKAKHP